MSPTLEALGIDKLSAAERIALAQEILDSVVAEQPPAALSEVKRQELERRLADHKANPAAIVPWEQIETEALARFRK
jgi:putative addiction module component (TIGR02574 family)